MRRAIRAYDRNSRFVAQCVSAGGFLAAFAIAAKCKAHSLASIRKADRPALITWLAEHSNATRGNDRAFFLSLEVYAQRVGLFLPGCTWGFLDTLYNQERALLEGQEFVNHLDDFRQEGHDIDIPEPQDWPYVSSDEE